MLPVFLLIYYMSSAACSGQLSRHRRTWIIDSFSIEEGHPGPFPYVLGKLDIAEKQRLFFDLYGEGVDEEPKGVLSIHKESGTVYVHKAVDYEEKKILKLSFEARKIDASLYTKLGVEISILDINDNPPRFQRDLYEISVDEGQAQGSSLLTLAAYDRDQAGTPNATFHYHINSVTPNLPDTEFTIDELGTVSFKGCLDYEVSDMFTITVEAKDHGEVVSLSSSTTIIIHVQDGNDHLPTISGQTGTSKVREGETGSSPVRLHVMDKDTPHSDAWRAKYTIHGDEGEHFKIETEPDTNDGILTAVKPLDFEEAPRRELFISVQNPLPYLSSCKVVEKTSSGLWTVDTGEGDDPSEGQPHTMKVIIEVEDVNDAPTFDVSVKEAVLEENAPVGTWVEKVTAVDPDSAPAQDFVYQVGRDPAGWVTVDPSTGDITTIETPDRESPHVSDGVYTVLLHAVDDGEPPRTGTATLSIHLIDQNDNVPQPTSNHLDVCVSDGPMTTDISATDLDDNPFAGPFTFELLGDVKGRWSLNPTFGYTAGLVKQPSVFAGPHVIRVKISDLQGQFGIYNLSVTVCDCSVTPNCQNRRDTARKSATGAVGIMFASLALLLSLLLLAFVVSCRRDFTALQSGESSGETLLASNIEKLGTDCKIPKDVLEAFYKKSHHIPFNGESLHDGKQHRNVLTLLGAGRDRVDLSEDNYNLCRDYSWTNQLLDSWTQVQDCNTRKMLDEVDSSYMSDAIISALLHRRLSSVQEEELLLSEDEPHLYAEEGDAAEPSDLDDISIPGDDLFLNALKDLGPKFQQLASICKPTCTKLIPLIPSCHENTDGNVY